MRIFDGSGGVLSLLKLLAPVIIDVLSWTVCLFVVLSLPEDQETPKLSLIRRVAGYDLQDLGDLDVWWQEWHLREMTSS